MGTDSIIYISETLLLKGTSDSQLIINRKRFKVRVTQMLPPKRGRLPQFSEDGEKQSQRRITVLSDEG